MKNPTVLVDVDDEGQVSVYWHDPEMSGRQAPEICVVYNEDRELTQCKLIEDFDELCQDQWTQQIF